MAWKWGNIILIKKCLKLHKHKTFLFQFLINRVGRTANEGPPLRIQYNCLVPIYVFPEIKLRDLIIMFCLPISTFMYLWAIYIFPLSVSQGLIVGIYKALTDTWMWKLGTRSHSFISGIYVSNFPYSARYGKWTLHLFLHSLFFHEESHSALTQCKIIHLMLRQREKQLHWDWIRFSLELSCHRWTRFLLVWFNAEWGYPEDETTRPFALNRGA